jgi:hypothetical protein
MKCVLDESEEDFFAGNFSQVACTFFATQDAKPTSPVFLMELRELRLCRRGQDIET